MTLARFVGKSYPDPGQSILGGRKLAVKVDKSPGLRPTTTQHGVTVRAIELVIRPKMCLHVGKTSIIDSTVMLQCDLGQLAIAANTFEQGKNRHVGLW